MHLSCHGRAVLQEPLNNGFLMSGGEFLTLRDLLGLDLSQSDLAVLSACDAGQMGTNLPDETISLPAGLLTAGVRGVVSPLWPVDSFGTLLIMARFYQFLIEEKESPAEALRAAQCWLRDTTNAEKAAHFRKRPAIHRELLLREPEERDEAGITRWAAFCYNGA
jgi:CHAT domain-containing protein